MGFFVYVGEFIETEDGEGDGGDQHEEGHVRGCGFVTVLWWFCWWCVRVDVLMSSVVRSGFLRLLSG